MSLGSVAVGSSGPNNVILAPAIYWFRTIPDSYEPRI
jgi:hypothetical protein